MPPEIIPHELIEIALDRAQGHDFELFAQSFLSAMDGDKFIPLGGMHDGGADGFGAQELLECGRASVFYQVTVQKDHRAKIRSTVGRLREVGRDPKQLVFVTSDAIPQADIEEDNLSDELKVRIRIRDQKYIQHHINLSPATQAAFKQHLASYTDFLRNVGSAHMIGRSSYVTDPSVYVFLQQEVNNRLGNNDLLKTLTDSLILWALNETDPDNNKLMTRGEMLNKILTTIPWSKQFINYELDKRLLALSQKGGANGREVRWYQKDAKYCLPYETRKLISAENAVDEALRIEVKHGFAESSRKRLDVDDSYLTKIAEMTLRTIELFFEKEGLDFSFFLAGDDAKRNEAPPNTVTDRIEDVLTEFAIHQLDVPVMRVELRTLLTEVFYRSTPKQRYLLNQLSRTYVLLFALRAEPKLVEYFQSMTANFRLYVGSDILVRALTERYLAVDDQQTRNMLKIAQAAGVQLLLTQPVLEELFTHLRATNYEFLNHFAEIEPYVSLEMARHSSKILIRTYFYAKEAGKTTGWRSFLGQFVSGEALHSERDGVDELRDYLTAQYSLTYLGKDEIEEVVNVTKVKSLTAQLLEEDEKKNDALAYNDALMVYGIYGLRRKHKESTTVTEFGYVTWWLTKETRIQKYTVDLVREQGARYIMRPEFLLNYLALAPSKADVVNTYKNIFPTTLGLQMGHRLNEDAFHKILAHVKEWKELEPGRVTAKLKKLNNTLKADDKRIYHANFRTSDEQLERIFLAD